MFIGLWATCGLLALAPRAAAADPTDADRMTARTLAVEGQTALERSDYRTASDRFARADALVHAPTLLLGLARAQAGLGKLVEAHESYQRIVREGVRPGSPPVFARAVDEATREVGTVAARLAWVTIDVSPPAGAAVVLDGVAISKAAVGAKRPVDPGVHHVRAMAPGYAARDETFSVDESQKVTLTLALAAVPGGARPDAPAQEGDSRDAKPAVGGGPADVGADASGRGAGNRIAAGVAFVIGAGGLVTGGTAGVLALRKQRTLERACPAGACGTDRQADIDDFHQLTTMSTVGFVVGGIGVATGIVLLVTAPSDRPSAPSSARLSAFVGPGTFGMRGEF
jgi:hypothetical protein